MGLELKKPTFQNHKPVKEPSPIPTSKPELIPSKTEPIPQPSPGSPIPKTPLSTETARKGMETDRLVPSLPTAPIPPPKAMLRMEEGDFIFEAKECKMSGQRAACIVTVTNDRQKTRMLEIYTSPPHSLLVDNIGNQYNPVEVQFGVIGGIGYASISQDVPPLLPINVVLRYKDIASDATHVNLIIDGYTFETGRFKTVLRGIPLYR